MSVIEYSSGCPKCRILESKLKDKDIEFTLLEDSDLMVEKGFQHAPMLEVNGDVFDFNQAIKFVNAYDSESDESFESFVTSKQSE